MDTKFLSLTGLEQYNDLIKAYVDTGLSGKAGSTHTHTISQIPNLQATLDEKDEAIEAAKIEASNQDAVILLEAQQSAKSYTDLEVAKKAPLSHTHDDLYYTESEIDTKLSIINTNVDKITSGDTVVKKAETATNATSATNATNASTATIAKDSEKLGGQLPSYYAKASDIPTGELAKKDSVSESDLDSALAEKVNAASEGNHSHSNKTVLDGITSAKISAWDSAEENAKTYTDTTVSNATKGMATTAVVDSKISIHNSSTASHSDIRETLAAVKEDVDAFFKDATISTEAKDTLKEIQDYITSDASVAAEMTASIANKADKATYEAHAASTISHITAAERTAWNAKADASHGTHVTWSTTSPKMNGTAAVGSETKVARGDHIHPTDTSRASKTEFDTHTASTVSHITASERTAWNAKASTASATTATAGLMSAADKTKLNGIAEGANKYTHPTTSGNKHIPSGGASGQFLKWSADGTAVWAADNDTKYAAGTGIALSGTTFSNSGVRSVVTGTSNGTIIVNTNGTTASVPVKGLGASAYKNSTTAVTSGSSDLVTSGAVYTVIDSATSAITANTNSITTLTSAINAIEEITLQEIAALFEN